MKKLFTEMRSSLLIIIIFGMSSCVSESTHQIVLDENRELRNELKELKYGVPNLYADAKKLYELGSFQESKEKINLLIKNHPDAVETAELKKMLPQLNEEILWAEVLASDNLQLIEKYNINYPKGKYSKIAFIKKVEIIERLDENAFFEAKKTRTDESFNFYLDKFPEGHYRQKAENEIIILRKENEQNAYQDAMNRNSSYSWKSFLSVYPNHKKKSEIEKRIISLEVDEILGSSNTGNLPVFSQTNYGYSTNSSVTIENNTGYELTVRYSGPTIKIIVIPRGGTSSTSLLSGSYKIAATANNLNYGGRENLSGSYSSSYYISTSRY